MGHEYIIRLRENDLEAFSRNPRGAKSVDALLKSVPIFKANSGSTYFYCSDEKTESAWFSYVVFKNGELQFCSYRGEDYRAVVTYLFEQLMDICGHFEIEDA